MFHNLKSQGTLDNSTLNTTIYKIEILNKNILYVTHQVDKLVVMVKGLQNVLALQKQVDDYFDEKDEDTAEQVPPE